MGRKPVAEPWLAQRSGEGRTRGGPGWTASEQEPDADGRWIFIWGPEADGGRTSTQESGLGIRWTAEQGAGGGV